MIDYTWTISNIEVYPEKEGFNNVVSTVHWRLRGEEGGVSTEVYGAVSLSLDETAHFIPFEELTEEDVVAWVKAALGDSLDRFEESIASTLERLKNPPVINPSLPWSN